MTVLNMHFRKEHATYIAKCSEETNVEVVYVVDNRTAKSDIIQGQTDLETISASRKDKLKEIEGLLKKENISYTLRYYAILDTIVQYVNTGDIDLVIAGSRGLKYTARNGAGKCK